MDEWKQTGNKSHCLYSGLVYYTNCGVKTYGATTHRKGHEYRRYIYSVHCGAIRKEA